MKKGFALFLICSLFTLLLSACGEGTKNESSSNSSAATNSTATNSAATDTTEVEASYTVAISQFVEHPSLDAVKDGIIAALADKGLVEGKNLTVDFQNAQEDFNSIQPISEKIANSNADVAVGIATPTAMGLADAITDKPVVFAAVSDPVDAKLVTQYEKPGGNVTGASDSSPEAIQKLMDFIATEFPNIKTLGIVINNGEPNAVIMADTAEKQLATHGIKLLRAAIANSSDVQQAAESLVGRVDGMYITLDNTVVSAIDTLLNVAYEHDLPFFSSDRDTVEAGALATVGFKYYDHGYEVGQLVADILLNGTNPGDIDVLTPQTLDFIINEAASAEMGVTVTDSMKAYVKDKENNLLK